MTCCVGVIKGSILSIAADRMISNGFSHRFLQEPKVWQSGKSLIAASGSMTMLRLKYVWEAPEVDTWDIQRWAATTLLNSLPTETWFTDAFAKSSLLMGVRDESLVPHLFVVDGNYSITHSNGKFISDGSGEYTANGALIAMSELNKGLPACEMARYAVKYSAEYTMSVGGDIDVLTI